ncbi:GNAT family N-acetyltransferase [Pseudoroseomonas rhizosphaerae]|uniref:GNAT family N-acetyltransferase n=1 Tax=Teichococcus rhizosphaerae TaxID=1335062 RepID=A0A2C7AAN9_9PROT|nr:GNAT family N-acetyltransferase [Pseudoroseomonas rhizosphaerae]PHK94713.1 GNAT family N-acetyltransferase [Pseudoroseomonas rhizosphaerae]
MSSTGTPPPCLARIVPAAERHLPAMVAIFNDIVAHTDAVYTEVPDTLEQRAEWHAQRRARGYPVLVALAPDEAVLGFASFQDFRPAWPGFRHSIEHSVHLRADARGRGLGGALLAALEEAAHGLRKRAMIASIDGGNLRSIRMHERRGFARVALMPRVACKGGRWLDLVLMQKLLGEGPPP